MDLSLNKNLQQRRIGRSLFFLSLDVYSGKPQSKKSRQLNQDFLSDRYSFVITLMSVSETWNRGGRGGVEGKNFSGAVVQPRCTEQLHEALHF